MATLASVLTLARTLARTDSNGLTDADGIAFANDALMDMYQKFTVRKEDFLIQDSTRDITGAELDTGSQPGRFLLPSDSYVIKNMWINMQDPTNQNLWYQAELYDVSNLPMGTTWEWLKLNQPVSQPLFDVRGDWFEIAPTPRAADITSPPLVDALRLTYFILPTMFTATGESVDYPYNMNTNLLAYKIAASYLKSYASPLWDTMQSQYEVGIKLLIEGISKGTQVPARARGLPLTGYEF